MCNVTSGARLNPDEQMRKVETPTQKTIEALVNDFGIDIKKLSKH